MTNPRMHPTGIYNFSNAPERTIHGLNSVLETKIVCALETSDSEQVRELLQFIHYSDVADLLERLDKFHRLALLEVIGSNFDSKLLSELDDSVLGHVVEFLGVDLTVSAFSQLESDDAVEVIEKLKEDQREQLLSAIPEKDRLLIKSSLSYPKHSAGRLMQRKLVIMPELWTIGDALDYLRREADVEDNLLPEQFHVVYVVDPSHRPIGDISLDKLLRNQRSILLADIMNKQPKTVPIVTDQEDVARLFRQMNLVAAPVIDGEGRLVGAITIDDVVDVIDQEHEEDILHLGGVREVDLYDAAVSTMKARFSWLFINLITAFTASVVIGFFNATIEEMVALAILMPVVASMGGNAGTQTLTVAVRAIAMKELTATNTNRIIGKEFLVGGFNGVLFAFISGLIAWQWFDNLTLGGVIGVSMIVNMVVAGFAGTVIPIALDRFGVDPAVASSIVLTTITDVVGFFFFLSLGAIFLL